MAQKHEDEQEDRKKQKHIFVESSLNKFLEDLTSQKKSTEFLKQRMMSMNYTVTRYCLNYTVTRYCLNYTVT